MEIRLKKAVRDYLMMTLGCFVFAFTWEGVVIPNEMSSGGLMGLCTVIQYATGDLISASLLYPALNVILLLFAFFSMGAGFGVRTIFCIGMTSLLMIFVEKIAWMHAVAGNFLALPDPILVPVIGGLLEGLSLGIIFRYGGSTGGTDILALFFSKHWPITTGTFYIISDAIIITSILFLPEKMFGDMVYGYIMMIISAVTVDKINLGAREAVQLLVFSDHYADIANHITTKLDRGVTILKAQGWYTKKEKDVMLVLISKKQLYVVIKLIKSVDPRAFLSVTRTSGVYGEGFEEMKTGLDNKKKKNEEK